MRARPVCLLPGLPLSLPHLSLGTNESARRGGGNPGPVTSVSQLWTSLWHKMLSGPLLGDNHYGGDEGALLP